MLKLSIAPRHGKWPLAEKALFDARVRRPSVGLFAAVVATADGLVRVIAVAAVDEAEGTARFIHNSEQGHWAAPQSSPLLAQALGHADWPAAFEALAQAERTAGRRVRHGRIRCDIVGVREG